MRLEVQDLSYSISREWSLLRKVSFAVAAGSVVGIFGENGCGKTTLLQIVAGAIRCRSGRVLTQAGQDKPPREIQAWPLWRRSRARIVYVPQENRIWPELSVQEHLDLIRDERSAGSDAVVSQKDVLNVLPPEKKAGNLSHGQQRYLLLMKALMLSPQVLLADEPLAGLDKDLQQAATARIRALLDRGMGCIVIEHDKDALAALGARLFRLEEGELHAS